MGNKISEDMANRSWKIFVSAMRSVYKCSYVSLFRCGSYSFFWSNRRVIRPLEQNIWSLDHTGWFKTSGLIIDIYKYIYEQYFNLDMNKGSFNNGADYWQEGGREAWWTHFIHLKLSLVRGSILRSHLLV